MKRKVDLGAIIGGLALLAFGIIILTNQNAFVKLVVILAGVSAFVDGVYTLIAYKNWKFVGITSKLTLTKGILMTVSGILGVIMPLVAAKAIVTVVVYVFAVMLVFSAFVAIQDAVVLKKIDSTIPRGHFLVEAAFSVLIAVVFFSNPTSILSAFVVIIGITLIVIASAFIGFGIIKK